jgi:hypothetical protein
MSVALHGNLRDFGIGEVFQLIGQQQKTGTLEVSDGELRLRVAFDAGSVVRGDRVGAYDQAGLGDMLVRTGLLTPQRLVTLERQIAERGAQLEALLRDGGVLSAQQIDEIAELVTRETLFELLRWTRGSFHFTAGPVDNRNPGRAIPAEQLLMDGLRMVDEWRAFDEAAVDPEAVFAPSGSFEDFRRSEPGEGPDRLAVAERLFLLIDGRQPVRRVVDLSRIGSFEGARWLTRFRRAGLIERVDPQLVARKQRRRDKLELPSGPSLGAVLAAVLPWLLLGAVVFAASRVEAPRPAASGALSEQAVLRAAGASFETLRLRNLADAYRYARGEWPGGMTDLRRFFHEARRHEPLAPLDPREYYVAQRGDSILVLAPEE